MKPNSRKPCNHLDGKTWIKYSLSIWNDIRKSKEEMGLQHPAMFPTSLAGRVIEAWSKKGDLVFDPFTGSGSTLLAAARLERRSLGIDLSPEYVELTKKRMKELEDPPSWQIYQDDARNLCRYLENNSVDLCLTSPPYWNILWSHRTADHKSLRHYGHKAQDLGTIKEYDIFLKDISSVFECVFNVLDKGKYCVVVVMDLRKKNKFYPLHLDLSRSMENIGFLLDDIIVWDRRNEYNHLRPLGYPCVFRVNKIHEYLLIFQKPAK